MGSFICSTVTPVQIGDALMMLLFLRKNELFCGNIDPKCDDGNAKARERVPEHGAVGKDGMFAPGLALCPGVAVDGLGHGGGWEMK